MFELERARVERLERRPHDDGREMPVLADVVSVVPALVGLRGLALEALANALGRHRRRRSAGETEIETRTLADFVVVAGDHVVSQLLQVLGVRVEGAMGLDEPPCVPASLVHAGHEFRPQPADLGRQLVREAAERGRPAAFCDDHQRRRSGEPSTHTVKLDDARLRVGQELDEARVEPEVQRRKGRRHESAKNDRDHDPGTPYRQATNPQVKQVKPAIARARIGQAR